MYVGATRHNPAFSCVAARLSSNGTRFRRSRCRCGCRWRGLRLPEGGEGGVADELVGEQGVDVFFEPEVRDVEWPGVAGGPAPPTTELASHLRRQKAVSLPFRQRVKPASARPIDNLCPRSRHLAEGPFSTPDRRTWSSQIH